MLDRTARSQLIETFEDYLEDRITAFEFDERLFNIETEGQTANEIIRTAWFYYDDVNDHKVNLDRSGWNYFQRLLLLLRSDAELEWTGVKRWRWTWDHACACALCLIFVVGVVVLNHPSWLPVILPLFGAASMGLSEHRRRRAHRIDCGTSTDGIFPFASYSQLRRIRKEHTHFAKACHREGILMRLPRTRVAEGFHWMVGKMLWIVASPLVLFCQAFPSVSGRSQLLVREPESGRPASAER